MIFNEQHMQLLQQQRSCWISGTDTVTLVQWVCLAVLCSESGCDSMVSRKLLVAERRFLAFHADLVLPFDLTNADGGHGKIYTCSYTCLLSWSLIKHQGTGILQSVGVHQNSHHDAWQSRGWGKCGTALAAGLISSGLDCNSIAISSTTVKAFIEIINLYLDPLHDLHANFTDPVLHLWPTTVPDLCKIAEAQSLLPLQRSILHFGQWATMSPRSCVWWVHIEVNTDTLPMYTADCLST